MTAGHHPNTLLRRYVGKRLSEYYAQPSHKVIGSIDSGFLKRIPVGVPSSVAVKLSSHQHPMFEKKHTGYETINFSALWGEWHWKRTYNRVYKEQQGMWLTPSELFIPYYSNILANFVVRAMNITLDNLKKKQIQNCGTFEIVELGGGRGTNAKVLLNHLRDSHPDIYERLESYTIFDTSLTLQALQKEQLIGPVPDSIKENHLHAGKIKFVNINMIDIAEGKSQFLSSSETPTVVIALELLDNLPHDKIGRCLKTNQILQAEIITHGAANDSPQMFTEIFSPIDDLLLQNILSLAPTIYSPMASQGPRWVPTVALGVLIQLFQCRPNSSIAFADFDWLPPPDVGYGPSEDKEKNEIVAEPAVGDPLVTDMTGKDYSCYLSTPSDALCDILFPTDFGRLAAFVRHIQKPIKNKSEKKQCVVSAMKQKEFLLKYGPTEVEHTKSWLTGYSPLIHDFANYSVLEVLPTSMNERQ